MRGFGDDVGKEAFLDLYDRAGRRLLVFLVRRMHDLDGAAEVWSECWAVAFEGWPRCRAASPGETEAWLWGIARHQLAGYYRAGAIERRALQRLGWTASSGDAFEDEELERVAELDVLREPVRDALGELSDMRRRAVQLRIVDGRSYADVAAHMGCSEDAARAHVSRGLRHLAAALDLNESLTREKTTR